MHTLRIKHIAPPPPFFPIFLGSGHDLTYRIKGHRLKDLDPLNNNLRTIPFMVFLKVHSKLLTKVARQDFPSAEYLSVTERENLECCVMGK